MPEISQQEHQISASEMPPRVKELPPAYVGSEIVSMLRKQKAKSGISFALATDIDNTFRRKDDNTEIDRQSIETTNQLAREASEADIPIIAVTGVDVQGVIKRMQSGDLPYVPVIAGAVGTELWIGHKDAEGKITYTRDEKFGEQFTDEKSPRYYPRQEVVRKADAIIGNAGIQHPDWELQFQHPEVEQAYLNGQQADIQPFKTSFYTFAVDGQRNNIQREFEDQFKGQKVVICEEIGYNQAHTGEARKKYCIDVLPVTKADVVNYLQEVLDIDALAVAGDSGNDKDLLTGAGDLAIQVGGAKKELVETIDRVVHDADGSLSMKKVPQVDGGEKFYYQEAGGARRGPDSILRGSKLLLRALRRFGQTPEIQTMATEVLGASKK